MYYHLKDLHYINSDISLLSAFRALKTTQKKIRKSIGRKEMGDARRRQRDKISLPLQQVIKQRYPALVMAVEDLDDCLCTTFLIAGKKNAVILMLLL